ncbi:MAG: hypothetical protein VW394_07760 [Candidatus Heimdallarchaeota archaeon]|tara:strand:+ start:1506 stop:1736 length:231 start_codon:yes stop_codon:yes gene_type:complete
MKSNEKCILKILKIHGNGLFTNEILQLTKNYPNLCKGCSSGNHIISSGLELINIGLIEKKIAKGGFKWYLKNINQE